ncbi:MAG: DUF1579 domain-containing protein [Aquaticitalea sp.]
MKTLLLTVSILLSCGGLFSQTPEEMKAWEASMTPGTQHKMLAESDGSWNSKVKMWMDPSQPPTESEATAKNEMILNGLYLRSTHTGNMMGMPFHGESITGYDNVKKKFFSTWIDNMGSGIMVLEGDYDENSKTLTLTGNMMDAMTGKAMEIKEKIIYHSPDKNTFEMYMIKDGKDIKTMEIVNTRIKE